MNASATKPTALTGESHGGPAGRAKRSATARYFALCGVLPLGVFLLFHLWVQNHALQGGSALADVARPFFASPARIAIAAALVYAPLALHAAYGLYLTITRKALPAAPLADAPTSAGVAHLMRASGIVLAIFLVYHLYERASVFSVGGQDAWSPLLAARLSSTFAGAPLRAMGYIGALAAAAFHFSAGVWGFMASNGYVITPLSRRLAAVILGVVGVAVFVVGANVVTYFATGVRLLGSDATSPLPLEFESSPCPTSSAFH